MYPGCFCWQPVKCTEWENDTTIIRIAALQIYGFSILNYISTKWIICEIPLKKVADQQIPGFYPAANPD